MKLFSVLFFVIVYSGLIHAADKSLPEFVGSLSCSACHQEQYTAWADSHHNWAWREPTKKYVLGDFNNADFAHAGFTYKFYTQDHEYFIIADNSSGKPTKYKVHSVAGVTPLQQYLIETGDGRLQALDVAWDTVNKRWYHLYLDEDTSAGNGMHWTGSYKNWNARCAECHATNYKKNYNPLKESYNSSQTETGVGCEACHGPGEAHVAWGKEKHTFSSEKWLDVNMYGLKQTYLKNDAASELNLCAGCHSLREPITSDSPMPGSHYTDHYRLATLNDGLYYSDGQIHDEVYVYGSFLQSKMHTQGVSCSNCHDMHSNQLKAVGNAVCTQCHNPIGNVSFPSLTKKNYDTSEHHFHKPDSDGAQCKQCHMPENNYMVVDGRRDHSFRIPRPDLTEKLGSPDVCTGCHNAKSPNWAIAEIVKHFPDSRLHSEHFADVFSRSTQQLNKQVIEELLSLAKNRELPAIVRASALQRLLPTSANLPPMELAGLLSDKNAWVRAKASSLLASATEQQKIELLGPLLSDPVKSVRLEVVPAFLNVSRDTLSFSLTIALEKAMNEYQQSLQAKADFPETQMVMGGVGLATRDIPAAIKAFETAVKMDPQLTQAWIMLSRIYVATGNSARAKQILKKALEANPENSELKRLIDKFGI